LRSCKGRWTEGTADEETAVEGTAVEWLRSILSLVFFFAILTRDSIDLISKSLSLYTLFRRLLTPCIVNDVKFVVTVSTIH